MNVYVACASLFIHSFLSLYLRLPIYLFTCLFASLQFHAGLLLFFQSHLCVRLDEDDDDGGGGADDGDLGILFSIGIGHS